MFWTNAPKIAPNKLIEPHSVARVYLAPISKEGRVLSDCGIIIAISPNNAAKLLTAKGTCISEGSLKLQLGEALERTTGIILEKPPSQIIPETKPSADPAPLQKEKRGFEISLPWAILALAGILSLLWGESLALSFIKLRNVKKDQIETTSPAQQETAKSYARLQNSIQTGKAISLEDYNSFPDYLKNAIDEANMLVEGRSKPTTPANKTNQSSQQSRISIVKDDGAIPYPKSMIPGRDQFGISNLPPPNTTASSGDLHLPMPGGNDFRSKDDAKNFGLGTFPSDVMENPRRD